MSDGAPRVLIVEDHAIITGSLTLALQLQGFEEVEAVPTDRLDLESVLAATERLRPDVVLLDLALGEGRTSVSMIGPLTERGAKVMMLTASKDRAVLAECLAAGAVALLDKAQPFHELVAAVRDVAAGRSALRAGTREDLLADLRTKRAADARRLEPFTRLTEREQHVLRRIIDGLTAEEIATADAVSIATVRTHIRALLDKLDVNNQLAAVALARRSGWPPDGPA